MKKQIAPSILSADFAILGQELQAMQAAGADLIHVDVMDGHFVPNLSLGIPVVQTARKSTSLPFDVHLMISQPQRYLKQFADAGADSITFHYESEGQARDTIAAIRALGKRVGISIKPDTPAERLDHLLQLVDMVLVMTVEPGFGGQAFREDMMPKLVYLRQKERELGLQLDLQVDGGISAKTIATAASAGANVFVAGSALFGQPDYTAAIAQLRCLAGGK